MMMRQCLFSINLRLLDLMKKVYRKLHVRVLEAGQWKQKQKKEGREGRQKKEPKRSRYEWWGLICVTCQCYNDIVKQFADLVNVHKITFKSLLKKPCKNLYFPKRTMTISLVTHALLQNDLAPPWDVEVYFSNLLESGPTLWLLWPVEYGRINIVNTSACKNS